MFFKKDNFGFLGKKKSSIEEQAELSLYMAKKRRLDVFKLTKKRASKKPINQLLDEKYGPGRLKPLS